MLWVLSNNGAYPEDGGRLSERTSLRGRGSVMCYATRLVGYLLEEVARLFSQLLAGLAHHAPMPTSVRDLGVSGISKPEVENTWLYADAPPGLGWMFSLQGGA